MEDSWFMDDLLGEPYADPVMAEDGYIYERAFIEEWFKNGGSKSPKTLLPMGTALFYPFEYYQMRSLWAKEKGMEEPKKPGRYGLCSHAAPQTDAPHPASSVSIQIIAPPIWDYYYYNTDAYIDYTDDEDDLPPLASVVPPTRPPIVRPAPPARR